MALVNAGLIRNNPYYPFFGAQPSYISTTITNTNTGVAWLFQAPSTGYVREFGFRVGSMGQAGTLTISLQTINTATGDASGTFWATGATGFFNVAVADSLTWKTVNLGTEILVHYGSMIALVIRNTATYAGSANLTIQQDFNGASYQTRFPYAEALPNTKSGQSTNVFGFTYIDSMSRCLNKTFPASTVNSANLSTNTQMGVSFTLPYVARVAGFSFSADMDSDSNLNFYDVNGSTILTKFVIRSGIRQSNSPGNYDYFFEKPIITSANSIYRIAINPLTTTSCNFHWFTVNTENLLGMLQTDSSFYLTQAPNPSVNTASWTDFKTSIPLVSLIIDQIDDGAGGGGSGTNTKINIGASLRAQI